MSVREVGRTSVQREVIIRWRVACDRVDCPYVEECSEEGEAMEKAEQHEREHDEHAHPRP